jgi:hypothetical protein
MCSLAHNTLRGRGACCSFGMGLGRIHKLIHSHGPTVATPLWPSVGRSPTLPKLGTWSPPGLSNVQTSIAGAKTPHIGMFLVSLERS